MEAVRYFIFLEALLAIFIAGGLFFRKVDLRSATIALLVALFGVHMLIFLYGSGEIVLLYPQFSGWFYYELGLLFGPLLIVHLQSLIFNKKQLYWFDILHLIPMLIFWIGYGDVLLMPGVERRLYVEANFLNRTMTWNYFLAIQLSIYALISMLLILRNKARLSRRNFTYAVVIVTIYIISTAIITWLTWFADGWRDFSTYYLVNSAIIFAVGYILFKDPEFFKVLRKKYFSSSLSADRMKEIREKIDLAFSEEHMFLQNGLSIKSLGKQITEKHYHVSQTFSEKIKENFNDYVNKHRVIFAKELLKDPEYHHLKIEAIALESGFNNTVTFYKAFTKFHGDTPSRYRKENTGK